MPSTSIWSEHSKSSDAFSFAMYLCYLDESGVPEIPGNSTHFVLAGIAIPIERWRGADAAISTIMAPYGLAGEELHTAWLLRKYLEQSRIDGFEAMDWDTRRAAVQRSRVAEVYRVRKLGIAKRNSSLKNFYRHTAPYVHLTWMERRSLIVEIARKVSEWEWARLFAACIDKVHFQTLQSTDEVNKHAFIEVMSRFAGFLQWAEDTSADEKDTIYPEFGLMIHDNNPTVASKHTHLMRFLREQKSNKLHFLERIAETPLFVDSSLTRMVQIADLCAYTLRRNVENGESEVFSVLFRSALTYGPRLRAPIPRTHIRHRTAKNCNCLICIQPDSKTEDRYDA
jgi:hypothetical protein